MLSLTIWPRFVKLSLHQNSPTYGHNVYPRKPHTTLFERALKPVYKMFQPTQVKDQQKTRLNGKCVTVCRGLKLVINFHTKLNHPFYKTIM